MIERHTVPFGALAASCLAVALLQGCSTPRTEFKPYEARVNEFEGKGGTKVVVDGMDFWENGEPPRKFTVLGIIEDERPGSGRSLQARKQDIVKLARTSGGDAVVHLTSQSAVSGYYAAPMGSSAIAVPLRRHEAKYAVIKYAD